MLTENFLHIAGGKERNMNPAILRRKFIEQIQRLPDEKLQELSEIIHLFRINTERAEPSSKDNVMRFAGCWDDISDSEFKVWLNEISERRSTAFSGRIQRETLIS